MSIIHTRTTLPDGRTLECEYSLHVIPGVHTLPNGDPGYPDEHEVGDPVFWLESVQLELEDMPQAIAQIAMRLYMESPDEFMYTDSPDPYDGPDHEPELEPLYDF